MGWLVLGLVLLLSVLKVPIGFVLAIATIIVVSIQGTAPLEAIPLMIFGGASKFPLLSRPLFILAMVLMTTCAIANLSMWDVFKTGFYYMMVLVLLTLLVTYVPQTGLWLVNLVYS